MVVTHHVSAKELLQHAGAFLGSSEAENALLLGICASRGAPPPGGLPLWISVDSEAGPVAVAIQTPPFNLVLSAAPEDALPALVDALGGASPRVLPGVTGPPETARSFADLWTRARGLRAETIMRQGLYELTRVVPPSPCAPGALRVAGAEDAPRVVAWTIAFGSETKLPPRDHEAFAARIRASVAKGDFYLWEDAGEPVSMAALQGATPHGIRVTAVYTPPELRGRGYASACVAALSVRALSERRFCMLYTDLGNPTSNAIYQRIGYERIGESTMIAFREDGASLT